MGFFGIGGNKKGVDCKTNQDGTETCLIYERDGNTLKASGTNFSVGIDPNSCEAFLTGEKRINNEDEEEVQKVLKAKSQGCKRGIA